MRRLVFQKAIVYDGSDHDGPDDNNANDNDDGKADEEEDDDDASLHDDAADGDDHGDDHDKYAYVDRSNTSINAFIPCT